MIEPVCLMVALEGAPCSGKSSCLKAVRDYFINQGKIVFVLNETATELKLNGVDNLTTDVSYFQFQNLLVREQLFKEQEYRRLGRNLADRTGKDFLLLCDRGLIDGIAFGNRNEFLNVMDAHGLSLNLARDYYDKVIYLETAINIKDTKANNEIRTDTPEQAQIANEILIKEWQKHQNFTMVPLMETIQQKQKVVIDLIEKEFDKKHFIVQEKETKQNENIEQLATVEPRLSYNSRITDYDGLMECFDILKNDENVNSLKISYNFCQHKHDKFEIVFSDKQLSIAYPLISSEELFDNYIKRLSCAIDNRKIIRSVEVSYVPKCKMYRIFLDY